MVICVELVRNLVAHGDAGVGEVEGKLANGVGSQYSRATSEHGLSSITQADAHTSAASTQYTPQLETLLPTLLNI